ADPRTQLELALTKAASPEVDPSARALHARIERLEQALAGGDGRPAVALPPVEPPPAPPGTPQPRAEAPAEAPAPEPESRAVAVADRPAGGLELQAVTDLWPAVVDAVRVDDDVLAMCLSEATPVDCAGRSLVIAFHPDDTM